MGGGLSKVGQNVKATINDLNAARKKRPPLGSYERHRGDTFPNVCAPPRRHCPGR